MGEVDGDQILLMNVRVQIYSPKLAAMVIIGNISFIEGFFISYTYPCDLWPHVHL